MSALSPLALKLHGIVFDLDPEDVPADKWTGGRNVVFKNGETHRIGGVSRFAETGRLFIAYFVHYVDLGPQEYWIYGGPQGVAVYNGTQHFDLTPLGQWAPIASPGKNFTVGDLNTLPFVNHPERGPFWWDGDVTHRLTTLPDWPPAWSCRAMRAHKAQLMAIGIDTGAGLQEMTAAYSSSADPGDVPEFWVPSPTNDAGDMTFSTPGGPLLDGISVRDQFFVMKANATYVGQYVGGTFVFQQRDIFPSVGILATGAAIEHGNFVYMVTGNGEVVRHDGNSVQNLGYGAFQNYFNRMLNYQFANNLFLVRDDLQGQIIICYPTGASSFACTEGISIEIASIGRGNMVVASVIDLPDVLGAAIGYTGIEDDSWDSAAGSWDTDPKLWNEQATGYRPAHIVFASGRGPLLEKDIGTTMDGAEIHANVERLGLEFDTYERLKFINQGFPRVSGPDGQKLYFRFGGQEQVRSPIEWQDELPFVIGQDGQLDFFMDARLIALSMRSDDGGVWNANGMMLTGRTSGKWR